MRKLEVVRQKDGCFAISCFDKQLVVEADEVKTLYNGRAVVVKNNGKWTLYGMSYYVAFGDVIFFEGIYKIVEDIYDFKSLENVFVFKKSDGWFFFFFSKALWHIGQESVREKRINNFAKICDSSINVDSLEICSKYEACGVTPNRYWYGYCVRTDDGKMFLLFSQTFDIYGACNDKCVRIFGYRLIKSYNNIARIYTDSKRRKFVVGTLGGDFGNTFSDYCLGCSSLGDGYFLLKRGKKTKLILVASERCIYTNLTDWGIHEITKLEVNHDELSSRWLIDGKEENFFYYGMNVVKD